VLEEQCPNWSPSLWPLFPLHQ